MLIGTPFGKRLRVRIKNMTTNDPLVMQPKNDDGDASDEVKNNPDIDAKLDMANS